MARPLAIEGEAGAARRRSRRSPPPRATPPIGSGTGDGGWRPPLPEAGRSGIFGHGGEHVGQHQLLMLLLMVEAELETSEGDGRQLRQGVGHRRIDMGPILADFVEAGAAEHAATRPRMPLPLAVIIGIEQISPIRVERLVVRHAVAQDEGLEEPARVGEMPFGGRCIRHRLDGRVGVGQRRGEGEAQRPHRLVSLTQGPCLRPLCLGRHAVPFSRRPYTPN